MSVRCPRKLILSGGRKAAILIAVMGEEAASSVLSNLPERDVHLVTRELSELDTVSDGLAHEVLEEYGEAASQQEVCDAGRRRSCISVVGHNFRS